MCFPSRRRRTATARSCRCCANMARFAWMAAAVLMLSGVGARAQNAAPASAGNAENGKRLFVSRDGCYECHGTQAQGGTGPKLAPRPLPLAALAAYIRKPAGGMPPYTSKVLPDSDLADIYAYLLSIPAPPPLKDLPLLSR
jgi:mono/diheme cytochrome c family protein